MDLISIIVPVYNVEKYIHQCVDSIINQTYTNLEIILVDDGSPDNCGKICDEYAAKDSRIKVIHKPNGGLSDARNCGIEAADGEWLMFIDSDDWIEPDMAQKLLDAVTKEKADMAVCSVTLFNEKERLTPDNYLSPARTVSGIQLLKEKWLNVQFIIACNKIYKKELFENIRYPVGKLHEDEFVIHYLLYEAKKVCVIEDKLYNYRQNENSITGSKYSPRNLDAFFAIADRICFYNQINCIDCAEPLISYYYTTLIEKYFTHISDPAFKKKLKRCRYNSFSVLAFFLRTENVSLNEKIAKICFSFFPGLYKKLFLK